MTVAVSIENVSKLYRLGVIGSGTLHEDVARWWARRRGRPDPSLKVGQTDHGNRDGGSIWALKDVSFSVQEGEIIGIIGRNGAGKSTLLKILSRVTAPTSGEVKIRGRVASLLEVGTGFHPELTGRENIFLNGAILGMTRAETKRKLDEIVAFAEIDQFIETPVKRYSSGMYVRLAFAVAAHLDPEILIVDEVLAVGDAEFQKKCLGKMGDVAKGGRTVMFVSHNMLAITRLCPRAILLHQGELLADGNSVIATKHYLRSDLGTMAAQEWPDIRVAPGDESVRLVAVRVRGENAQVTERIDIRKSVEIEMEYQVLRAETVLRPWLAFWNDEGVCAFATTDTDIAWIKRSRSPGRYISVVLIPGNFLSEGGLTVTAGMTAAGSFSDHFIVNGAVVFQVVDSLEGDSARGQYGGSFPGVVRPKLIWTTTIK